MEVVIGSTNVNRHLKRQLERVGIAFTVAYGQVECGGLVCYTPAANYDPETVGMPISDIIKCRVRPMEIKGLPDETGILEIRGMTIMKDYYNDPESTQEAFTQDGWLSTRDLGYIDEHGNVIIVGRIDSMIERPDGTIIPERIEAKILNSPEIKQVVVTDRDGITTAIVVPDNARISGDRYTVIKRIIDNVNANVPAFANIEEIEISDLPLDLTLKGTVARYKYY